MTITENGTCRCCNYVRNVVRWAIRAVVRNARSYINIRLFFFFFFICLFAAFDKLGCRAGWALLAMHAKTLAPGVGKERSISEQTDSFAFAFVVDVRYESLDIEIDRRLHQEGFLGIENCRRRCYRDAAAPVN